MLYVLLLTALAGARIWGAPPILDQGSFPYCVGYAWSGFLLAGPLPWADTPTGLTIYEWAAARDGLTPTRRQDAGGGTYGWAAVEALTEYGYLDGTVTTSTARQARWWLRVHGPVVFEGDWPATWSLNTKRELAWGRVDGRHEWVCYGVDANDDLDCMQSWGVKYGPFRMTPDAQDRVLSNGTAWLPWKANGS